MVTGTTDLLAVQIDETLQSFAARVNVTLWP
jgi:hypothetical protein